MVLAPRMRLRARTYASNLRASEIDAAQRTSVVYETCCGKTANGSGVAVIAWDEMSDGQFQHS